MEKSKRRKDYDFAIAITAGIDEDLEVFLFKVFDEFEKHSGPRFSVFTTEWKKGNFGLIWCGRESFRDMFDFTEELFNRTKKYILPTLKDKPNNTLVRYAALYLMYSLYFKQPCRPRVHFRLKLEEYKHILSLTEQARKDSHWDVMYAWSKLFTSHAFHYAACHTQMGIEMAYQAEQRDHSDKFGANSCQDYFKSKEFVQMMNKVGKSHSKYVEMKKRLADNNDPEDSSLFMIDSDFVTSLKKCAMKVDKEEIVRKAKEQSKVGQSRRSLKYKFYERGGDDDE